EWLKKKELAIFNSIKEAEELGYEPYKSGPQRTVMDEDEIQSAVEEMSRQIARDHNDLDRLLILGIRTKGSLLAQRIAAALEHEKKGKPKVGRIEVSGAGDELRGGPPADCEASSINLRDRTIILVDDVIYTGRTVKSALTIIFRSGRPQSVRLAVLI